MPAARPSAAVTTPAQAVTARDALVPWMAPDCIGINRLAGRATLWPYASAADAQRGKGAFVQSLNGTWDFRLVERVEDTPAAFVQPGFVAKGWATIPVPGNWAMHGFDRPQYSNWKTVFSPSVPPVVPEQNLTGLYRTTFRVSKAWAGRRVVLHFGGVESCFSVWVNGVAVGLGKDSRLPSEFDITAHLVAGENTLAVQVIKWSDGTYLEDQDNWRNAGIHRDVVLYATAPTWIEDVFARGGYDPATGAGTLCVRVKAGNLGAQGWTAEARLLDPKGKAVLKKPLAGELPQGLRCHTGKVEATTELTTTIAKVAAWSAEAPALYTLVVVLRDAKGREVEATRTRIGFRTIEIRDRQLLINGKMVYIRGANRHDHSDRTGKVIDRATMLKDISVLKSHHFNAVRCSHYPNDPLWLDLCDEHGLYVIDETDLEAHDHYGMLAHEPRWAAAFLDRASRMVLRDRNHPCIFAWSLGNETGYGPNHDAMAGWIRHADPSRILHYEGAICCANSSWERGHAATDLVCPMYPSVADLVQWATTTRDWRPLIMCEYAHAMGNSCGNLKEYWEAIEGHHGLQGGFIWELLDHGLVKTTEDGREYWAYGGDFGDEPNDTNFCCDGLVWPDRRPHPAMQECKRLFQPIAVTAVNPAHGEVAIRSRYDFIGTAHLAGRWELTVDGTAVAQGALPKLDLRPGEERRLQIPFALPLLRPGQEAHLQLRFRDTRDLPLLGKGHEVAWAQVAVAQAPAAPAVIARTGAKLAVEAGKDAIAVRGERVELVVDRASGRIAGWAVDGVQRLQVGPQATCWRAPMDNDGIRKWDMQKKEGQWIRPLVRWMNAGLDRQNRALEALTVKPVAGGAQLRARLLLWGDDRKQAIVEDQEVLIGLDGTLAFRHAFAVPQALPDLPRLGVTLIAPDACEALEWFGRGPHETYCDRQAGAWVGRFAANVADRYVPYIMPQEHGNVTELRWLALRRPDGAGLLASADGLIEGKATRYSDEALTKAWHTVDVAPEKRVLVHLDVRQRGVGGMSCGPDTLEQYRVASGRTYRLGYRLLALAKGVDPAALHRGG